MQHHIPADRTLHGPYVVTLYSSLPSAQYTFYSVNNTYYVVFSQYCTFAYFTVYNYYTSVIITLNQKEEYCYSYVTKGGAKRNAIYLMMLSVSRLYAIAQLKNMGQLVQ
jgi:hypothetical protein